VNTSVIERMAYLARVHNAINLTNGYSDFPCPPELRDMLLRFIQEGYNKYAPCEGAMELRVELSGYYQKRHFKVYNPETEITITAGATQAISTAIASVVNEGDEVIVFEPTIETYVATIEAKGARPKYLNLKTQGFTIDWNEVQKAITTQTKLIILSSPNNPTGSVLTMDDLEKLQKMINGTKIKILSDEALGEVLFGDSESCSVAIFPKLAESSFIVGSLGKSACVPGWKIGYCLAPAEMMRRFREVHRYQVQSVNYPMQMAFAGYIKGKDSLFPYPLELERNQRVLTDILGKSRFVWQPARGSYFQVLGYEAISAEKDTDFAERLVREHGVATVPMSVFYHDATDNRQLRLCLGKPTDELVEAANRLANI